MRDDSEEVLGEPVTVDDLLDVGERVIGDSQQIDAEHDEAEQAADLLEAALGCPLGEVAGDQVVPARTRDRYLAWVARRAAGEPIPLITGWATFGGLDLRVERGVFLPRPSSEFTLRRVVRRLSRRRAPTMVDLGTGSGAIALAAASRREDARVWGTDVSDLALRCARRNARRLGLSNVSFAVGDLYDGLAPRLAGAVDVVVANVPYVEPDEIPTMAREILDFEPHTTLTDMSSDGLDLMRRAVGEAPRWLKPGGWLLVQVAEETGAKVARLMEGAGLVPRIETADDSWDVVVEGRRPRR